MNVYKLPAEILLSRSSHGITHFDSIYSNVSADGRTGQITGQYFTALTLGSSQSRHSCDGILGYKKGRISAEMGMSS